MNLKRLGNLMSHWHRSMNDPIYAVGSYFIDGHKYPDLEVVKSALENIQKDINVFPRKGKSYGWTDTDLTELVEIRDGLNRYIAEESEDENFTTTVCAAFFEGVKGALWNPAWADFYEEHGGNLSGCAIENVSPTATKDVETAANEWIDAFRKLNGFGIVKAYKRACEADDLSGDLARSNYAEELGHYLVMQGLGHGVGWLDDHKTFEVKFPRVDAYVYTNTKRCQKKSKGECRCKLGFEYSISGSGSFR